MKRIICLCVVLFCSISFAFAQGSKAGRTKAKKPVSRAAIAENAWKVFFPKFKQSVINRDYHSVKAMMVKNVECGIGDPLDDYDKRDECLSSWKNSTNPTVDWNDFSRTVSGKICILSKANQYSDYEFTRFVVETNCNGDSEIAAGFEFIKGAWFLSYFSQGESG